MFYVGIFDYMFGVDLHACREASQRCILSSGQFYRIDRRELGGHRCEADICGEMANNLHYC